MIWKEEDQKIPVNRRDWIITRLSSKTERRNGLALALEKKQYEELTDIQKETIMRIKGEPGNMQVDD